MVVLTPGDKPGTSISLLNMGAIRWCCCLHCQYPHVPSGRMLPAAQQPQGPSGKANLRLLAVDVFQSWSSFLSVQRQGSVWLGKRRCRGSNASKPEISGQRQSNQLFCRERFSYFMYPVAPAATRTRPEAGSAVFAAVAATRASNRRPAAACTAAPA